MTAITGNIIFSNNLNPSIATLLVVDVGAGVSQTIVQEPNNQQSVWSLSARTVNFNSTAVGADEADLIAQKVAWMVATAATSSWTVPVSGITVVGNGAGLGVTVAGVSLTQLQAQQFASQVGRWATTTP